MSETNKNSAIVQWYFTIAEKTNRKSKKKNLQ